MTTAVNTSAATFREGLLTAQPRDSRAPCMAKRKDSTAQNFGNMQFCGGPRIQGSEVFSVKNSLHVIFPYKRNGVWAFDDPSVGLLQEPFVLGVPEMIEELVNYIPGAENGFTLFFSTSPFPNARELQRVRNDAGGNWYRHCDSGLEGWLCPCFVSVFQRRARAALRGRRSDDQSFSRPWSAGTK